MTKPIRYVLNKPKEYFVYDMAGKFVPVKGTPIKVPGLEGEDLFWHQDLSGFGGRGSYIRRAYRDDIRWVLQRQKTGCC